MRSGAPKGTDTVYAIEAANPELADVIKTLKTTYAVLGGAYDDSTKDLDLATFDGRRTFILAELHRLEVQCDTKMNAGLNPRSKDYIRLKIQIEKGLSQVKGHFKELHKIVQEDAKKKKLAAEEQGRRANDLKMLVREVKRVQGLAKGEVVSGADEEEGASRGEFGARIIRAGDLEKDAKPGAPLRVQQEAMTGQQQAQLTQVRAIMQEQDDMLDQISEALDGLKETSQAIGDELTAQTQMLADTEEHMDETQNKLDSVNDRLDQTLKVANSKSTAFCSYVICIFILLGIATVLYNVVTG